MSSPAISIDSSLVQFAADVRAGLTKPGQKELPSKYLYDTVGSRLFDATLGIPEFAAARAEERILRMGAAEIGARLQTPRRVAELGNRSGQKAQRLLEAGRVRDPTYR